PILFAKYGRWIVADCHPTLETHSKRLSDGGRERRSLSGGGEQLCVPAASERTSTATERTPVPMNVAIFESTVEIDDSCIVESPAVIHEQVREYERGDRHTFDLTVTIPSGMTDEVMTALTDIPYGKTRTYGALASDLDTIPVAIGQACAR